jgi:hypothetical protein
LGILAVCNRLPLYPHSEQAEQRVSREQYCEPHHRSQAQQGQDRD